VVHYVSENAQKFTNNRIFRNEKPPWKRIAIVRSLPSIIPPIVDLSYAIILVCLFENASIYN